ncbi:MAG: hypothetical protein ACXWMC_10585, partial [Syntrophales bacterium]
THKDRHKGRVPPIEDAVDPTGLGIAETPFSLKAWKKGREVHRPGHGEYFGHTYIDDESNLTIHT